MLHTDGKGEPLQPEPKKKKRLSTKEDIKARMAAEAMDMLASGEPYVRLGETLRDRMPHISDSIQQLGSAHPS